jgi:GMP synthase (glutamine-hydrolysing)
MKNYFEEKSDLYGASYLRNFNKPILGICLGMQILARLAGVSLVVSKELGLSRVWLDGGNDLFKGMKSPLEVCQRHNYALPYVPHGYSIIARNDSTFIQAIASKDNLKYGIQFHPEEIDLGSEMDSLKIFSNFASIVERHSTENSGGGK